MKKQKTGAFTKIKLMDQVVEMREKICRGIKNLERNETPIDTLELPVFNREDPMGWIFKAERYFLINHIS